MFVSKAGIEIESRHFGCHRIVVYANSVYTVYNIPPSLISLCTLNVSLVLSKKDYLSGYLIIIIVRFHRGVRLRRLFGS